MFKRRPLRQDGQIRQKKSSTQSRPQSTVQQSSENGQINTKPKTTNSKSSYSKRGAIKRGPQTQVKNTNPNYKPKNNRSKNTQRKNFKQYPAKTSGSNLKIYPLGGQEEVGLNCTVFEYDNDIVILDMGLQFPDEDMPGIDYLIPNVSCLENKKQNVRGVVFSHGHLDHIGAAPMLLEKLGNPPIVGRDLTLAMIKHRQEDYKKNTAKNLKILPIKSIDQKITLGKFKISFFKVEHSIIDAVGVIIETPHGTVIHPGDWTVEHDPDEKQITYDFLSKLPSPRILMLESLGVSYTKKPTPTKVMMANLYKLVSEAPGRVIIGTFSSQMERITHLLEYGEKLGKKVAFDGYSMKMNVKISQELGYIKPYKNTIIKVDDLKKYPDNKVVLICTGAQGESNAAFSRIFNGNHRFVTIQRNDTVIFSSSVIPGNERSVQKIKDQIYHLTDNVIHNDIMDVHSGGHATADDIKDVLHQIKPDYFLPVYANYYMLVEAKKLALREGFKPEQVYVLENGNVLEFKKSQKPKLLKAKVNTDYVMVDGLGVGDISDVVLRDRQVMSDDGMIVVIATIYSKTQKLVGNPDIISRGFVYMKDNRDLIEKTRKKVRDIVEKNDSKTRIGEDFIKNKIRNDLGQFLFQKTERRPMVLPVIIKV